ncbi:Uncharacterised protein [uncultured archaeon]|nr:Uncharacterised protein [uncultured archaeon]
MKLRHMKDVRQRNSARAEDAKRNKIVQMAIIAKRKFAIAAGCGFMAGALLLTGCATAKIDATAKADSPANAGMLQDRPAPVSQFDVEAQEKIGPFKERAISLLERIEETRKRIIEQKLIYRLRAKMVKLEGRNDKKAKDLHATLEALLHGLVAYLSSCNSLSSDLAVRTQRLGIGATPAEQEKILAALEADEKLVSDAMDSMDLAGMLLAQAQLKNSAK